MTAKQFLAAKRKLDRMTASIKTVLNELREAVVFPPDEKLRRACSKDIKIGAVIYYKESDFGPVWYVIEEVHAPDSEFKAFTADDGCRYGLDGAFVEKA